MKKSILVLGLVVAGAGSLAAATTTTTTTTSDSMSGMSMSSMSSQPQWLLDGDGLIGVRTEPASENGHGLASLGAGIEYIPNYFPELGWEVGYDYLAETDATTATGRDNYVDLALNYYYYDFSTCSLWVKAGLGYNTSRNTTNDHFKALIGPGVRWYILPRLALDGSIQYMSQTPSIAFVQSFNVNLGLSIPLDANFSMGGSSK